MAGDREQPPAADALDALRSAYETATRAIEASPDSYTAYLVATELTEAMRQLTMKAAMLRAVIAARIADEEKLPLSILAAKLNMSKSRAQQLVGKGRGGQSPRRDARVGGWGCQSARGLQVRWLVKARDAFL